VAGDYSTCLVGSGKQAIEDLDADFVVFIIAIPLERRVALVYCSSEL